MGSCGLGGECLALFSPGDPGFCCPFTLSSPELSGVVGRKQELAYCKVNSQFFSRPIIDQQAVYEPYFSLPLPTAFVCD